MQVLVKYKGRRAETLKKYNHKKFRGGPYDFSKGECLVDEKDADCLLERNPIAFEILKTVEEVAADALKEAKEAKEAKETKPTAPAK